MERKEALKKATKDFRVNLIKTVNRAVGLVMMLEWVNFLKEAMEFLPRGNNLFDHLLSASVVSIVCVGFMLLLSRLEK